MKKKLREYKGERYRKFCLKLKKNRLFARFLILEYYFRFYENRNNSYKLIYNYLENKNKDNIMCGKWFKNGERGTYLDFTDKDVYLEDFFKHYKV